MSSERVQRVKRRRQYIPTLAEQIAANEASLKRWDEVPEDEVDNEEYQATLARLVALREERDSGPQQRPI